MPIDGDICWKLEFTFFCPGTLDVGDPSNGVDMDEGLGGQGPKSRDLVAHPWFKGGDRRGKRGRARSPRLGDSLRAHEDPGRDDPSPTPLFLPTSDVSEDLGAAGPGTS